ncbi:MAG: Sua5/YciO/YrdC/YwlC family protein [Alphaproteobacteria bacterium]|nr:Sua5/YciO/YrdC/YwlC family protein [Alphaproteobacteria bacterium]
MARLFDVEGDAARAFTVLEQGGIAIMPNSIGYSIVGGSGASLRRIFETKKRAASKRNAMVGNHAIHAELHDCGTRGREIVTAITGDYDLPLGCLAPCRMDHPMLRPLDAETLEASTRDATLVILLNAGRFHEAITRMSHRARFPLLGSSANLTLGGTKFRVEDIEPEILAIADVVIDHGLQRYHPYGASSTLLNVETLEVVRFGACYEDIAYILKRHFGVTLPPRPRVG